MFGCLVFGMCLFVELRAVTACGLLSIYLCRKILWWGGVCDRDSYIWRRRREEVERLAQVHTKVATMSFLKVPYRVIVLSLSVSLLFFPSHLVCMCGCMSRAQKCGDSFRSLSGL
jgi:hypothetical protein